LLSGKNPTYSYNAILRVVFGQVNVPPVISSLNVTIASTYILPVPSVGIVPLSVQNPPKHELRMIDGLPPSNISTELTARTSDPPDENIVPWSVLLYRLQPVQLVGYP
jgi:hypothetical protein